MIVVPLVSLAMGGVKRDQVVRSLAPPSECSGLSAPSWSVGYLRPRSTLQSDLHQILHKDASQRQLQESMSMTLTSRDLDRSRGLFVRKFFCRILDVSLIFL